ncbi:hypothetical protein SADUNF_Sadunf03G0060200 [Salix dunnii]|uniref:Uncharacterized protein n=1 Tax=Salix dunnii TaxID=1413687 RepID=A0A835N479_9ROSI|nr:hypothetical protein SADUNF_Sadunf03G0060200 [Salix dunnii]
MTRSCLDRFFVKTGDARLLFQNPENLSFKNFTQTSIFFTPCSVPYVPVRNSPNPLLQTHIR